MENLKLSELARLWFLLHRTGNEPDTNAEILAPYEGTDAPLKDLLPGSSFHFQHENPLIVAALDERVRRACAMIVEEAVYDAYLSATKETFYAVNEDEAAPSGKPLPNVAPEIRKKASDRG
jgi:hypothetical protein